MTPELKIEQTNGKSLAAIIAPLRVYVLCVVVLAIMASIAPRFLTAGNIASILKTTSTNLYAAVAFTLVLLSGQLDLSVGTTMTLGGMLTIGLQPRLGWAGSVAVATCAGVAVGMTNGLLVARAKINSFIVTLGVMTILGGIIKLYCHGGTLGVDDFTLADWLDPARNLLTPRVILSLIITGIAWVFLQHTARGRAFYLIGANRQTAQYSGIGVNTHIVAAFVISGILCAFGGAMFAISVSSANPTMGDKSLMLIIAAVIIGGASMNGGRGSVIQSGVALLTLVALINGLGCLGAGFEIQLIASGAVLASVIIYDALRDRAEARVRGQRHELLAEVPALKQQIIERESTSIEGESSMPQNDRTFALACITITGCVAIVAIYAMSSRPPAPAAPPPPGSVAMNTGPGQTGSGQAVGEVKGATAAPAVDPSTLKASDGQPLLALDDTPLHTPPRPADPTKLADDDLLRWYDLEYAGQNVKKEPMPAPPPGGAAGKHVLCLRFMDHPYFTAYSRGMQKVADLYGIQLKTLVANNDINIQSQQVDQAINEKPDLVIITPVDATAVVPLLRKMHDANLPVIASNVMPIDQGMPYVLTWTGPDDWGQFRVLARDFAKRMNYEGGYCIVRHMPGSSPFFSRTFAMTSELKKIAPKMQCLDMQPTGLEAEKTMQVVSDWITRFGPQLKGIVSADDSGAQIGIDNACKNAKREDIIRVAAGNSKVGMDAVKAGELAAITYQSPEGDGAIPMKLAADYLNGKPIDKPLYFLKKQLINKDNVDGFLPPQW